MKNLKLTAFRGVREESEKAPGSPVVRSTPLKEWMADRNAAIVLARRGGASVALLARAHRLDKSVIRRILKMAIQAGLHLATEARNQTTAA